jgi:hypothetical protein
VLQAAMQMLLRLDMQLATLLLCAMLLWARARDVCTVKLAIIAQPIMSIIPIVPTVLAVITTSSMHVISTRAISSSASSNACRLPTSTMQACNISMLLLLTWLLLLLHLTATCADATPAALIVQLKLQRSRDTTITTCRALPC